MKRSYFLLLLLFLITSSALGQTGSVKGRIYNEKNNEPVPFANVVIVGTNIGSTTDFDGNFIITGVAPGFWKLTATSVGFEQYFSEEFQITTTRQAYVEIPLKETSVQLQTVVVKSEVFKKREESPTSMRTIGVSEIEKNPGGNRDISKILQTLPGVGSTVSFRNDLIVRGGGPNENRFYIDNIEIPNLNHFATQGASGGPVSIINADFLREVDFYSGSFPASKGNALSSVLDMKMLEGNKEKMRTKLTLGASDVGLTLNGPTGENSSLIFSFRRSYLQLLFGVIGLPFLPTYNDFQLKQTISFSQKTKLTFIGIGALDQSRLNLSQNETEEQQYILNYLPETDQWNYTIGASLQHFSDQYFDTWVLSRNMLRNKSYKFLENNESLGLIQDYSSDEIENKARFERTYIREKSRLTVGAGAEYAKYINNTFQRIFFEGNPAVIDYNSFLELYKGSAFAQYSGTIGILKYTAGLRTDFNNYSSSMLNPLRQLSPRLGLSWPVGEKLTLNFGAGRFNQLPAYTTLGYRDQQNVLVNKQNNLTYINSTQGSAGFEYLINSNTQFVAEGFYKHYNNYPFSVKDSISLANKGGDFGVVGDEEVVSTGIGRAWGFELLGRSKQFGKYSFLASYTFVLSEFQDVSGEYVPTAWDQRHLLNVLFTRVFKRNWTAGVKWRYAGGSPYTPYDETLSSLVQAWDARGMGYLDYERFNTMRLPAAHQLDIRVDKEYYLKRITLNFYLDIQNLYNFKASGQDFLTRETDENGNPVIINPGSPAEEQRYALKSLKNTSGTILPTLGIIVEF
jgi:hypothetical protein